MWSLLCWTWLTIKLFFYVQWTLIFSNHQHGSSGLKAPYPKYVYVIDPDSTAICTIGKEKKTPRYWFTSTGSKTAISKSVTNILIGWVEGMKYRVMNRVGIRGTSWINWKQDKQSTQTEWEKGASEEKGAYGCLSEEWGQRTLLRP